MKLLSIILALFSTMCMEQIPYAKIANEGFDISLLSQYWCGNLATDKCTLAFYTSQNSLIKGSGIVLEEDGSYRFFHPGNCFVVPGEWIPHRWEVENGKLLSLIYKGNPYFWERQSSADPTTLDVPPAKRLIETYQIIYLDTDQLRLKRVSTSYK